MKHPHKSRKTCFTLVCQIATKLYSLFGEDDISLLPFSASKDFPCLVSSALAAHGHLLPLTQLNSFPPSLLSHLNHGNDSMWGLSVRGCSQILSAKMGGPDPHSPLRQPLSAFPQPPLPPMSAIISIFPLR